MASRAGARLLNLEFIQFHPTACTSRARPRHLITEALRGAGARLANRDGELFMWRYHPQGALAPRDVVARSIIDEMHRTGAECVFLDLGGRGAELKEQFPTVAETCARYGIDMARDRIRWCRRRTTLRRRRFRPARARHRSRPVRGGEVACTGLHGANRLASTSLLEGLTFGLAAGADAARRAADYPLDDDLRAGIPDWEPVAGPSVEDPALIAQDWSRSGTRCGITSASSGPASGSSARSPTSVTSSSA